MATVPVPMRQSAPAPSGTPDTWRSLRTDMDRFFDTFTSRFGMTPFFPRFDTSVSLPSPAVDITEDENAFKISAEVPGMSDKDIEVSLSDETLTIKGEKREEREEKDTNRFLSERSYGVFQRSFSLPDNVARDQIAASFANGVLTITLPKAKKSEPKKIEVKAA